MNPDRILSSDAALRRPPAARSSTALNGGPHFTFNEAAVLKMKKLEGAEIRRAAA
jgi:hypothetical protein